MTGCQSDPDYTEVSAGESLKEEVAALVKSLQLEWSETVFRQLMRKAWQKTLAAAFSHCGRWEMARGAAVEAFEAFAKKPTAIRDHRCSLSWFEGVASNIVRTCLRISKKEERQTLHQVEEQAVSREEPPDQAAERSEENEKQQRAVEKMVACLSEKQRRLLALKAEGLCYTDIARVLGGSAQLRRVEMHRLRKKVRANLADERDLFA